MKTVLTVKTDVAVKKGAQKLAKEMGVPLSTIVNAQLKQFIRDRRLEMSAPLIPNAKTRKILDEALADIRRGDMSKFSPAFSTANEALEWLHAK